MNKSQPETTVVYDTIRIVHTNKPWQDSKQGWCQISVYDQDDNLITTGHDVLRFQERSFYMECVKDVEGFSCYGAKFEFLPGSFSHNTLIINVIK